MLVPAVYLGALSSLVIDRSACGAGVSVSVAVLLPATGSGVVLEIVAKLARLPVKPEPTWITTVNVWVGAPATRVDCVAVRVPLAPTAVVSVRVQPAGRVTDTKVVPAGRASLSSKDWASLGP